MKLSLISLSVLFLFSGLLLSCRDNTSRSIECIDIMFWYGPHQVFGKPGLAQRWINILGYAKAEHGIKSLSYSLNSGDSINLSWGKDNHRLANDGDFNIDIHYRIATVGNNHLQVFVEDSAGHWYSGEMNFEFVTGNSWPLPYIIEWDKVKNIQNAAQVVDGNWELRPGGIRTLDPWYDRVIAFGDSTWENYEVETSVIFHGYTSPVKEPPNYGVSHAALASRWPGHDLDQNQPHQKWYPLGATCEFQLMDNLDSCRWRILGGRNIRTEDVFQNFPVQLGMKYSIKSCVENLDNSYTRYRVKIWPFGEEEPGKWDLSAVEGKDDVQKGSALIIAHNTDVTFGDIFVNPVR